ncbi:hypothetical protein F2Q70_00038660 [Brassica cretica]|uniref:Uncharacterized protein n=1 Tax=Brassica cretica TaxID=69181 RepID=A0A8S9KCU7_BRACR|nr:hypothetical protein F2Q70_00038660 [Brassica cretica]
MTPLCTRATSRSKVAYPLWVQHPVDNFREPERPGRSEVGTSRVKSMECKGSQSDVPERGGDPAHAVDRHRPTSIDRHHSVPIDDNPKNSHSMKSQPDFHTIAEIDQLVEGIYRTMETTEERLDRRCDDIYFPMDLSMSALTSKIETIQWELVEIQSYISRRPEASAPIDRRNNKSTDIHRQTSVDEATNRGRLVPKVTSDMSDTHNHGEEI